MCWKKPILSTWVTCPIASPAIWSTMCHGKKLLSHCVPILFFILDHASCIEFMACKEAVKTLSMSTVWQNAVNIQSLLFGLNRMSFWIIIMHMVTLHYVHLQTWEIRRRNSWKPQSISLLSTMYKILSNILLSRLTQQAEEIIGDHQCGFQHNRSTTDHILCICHIIEKRWEYNRAVPQLLCRLQASLWFSQEWGLV